MPVTMTARPHYWTKFLAALLAVTVTSAARAAEKASGSWDATRTTSPESIVELRALQDRVKEVTKTVMPTTVGLLVGPAAGSGVIVSDDGLVLTAAHVIGKPGDACRIVLSDGSVVSGKTLGVDARTDCGMVQITSKVPKGFDFPGKTDDGKWPAAELGKSADLKKNQWVISLGHHGGPRKDRTPPLRLGRFDYFNKTEQILKTDCTLVGGDSGGPLFDLNGKVVGIHSKIGIFLDYNMHVPIDTFRDEWDGLAAGDVLGKARVELGVTLTDDEGEPTIEEVTADTAAAQADLQVGDVIVRFDGRRVRNRNDLKAMLMNCRPGQSVTLVVKRDEETVTAKVTFPKARRR